MHLRPLIACAAGLMLAAPLAAQPDAKKAGPTLAVQVQSLDELIGRVKATAKNFLPAKVYQDFEKDALKELDPKRLPGIDPKRPFALYATLDGGVLQGDFTGTHAVVLVPVADEKQFLALVEKTGAKPTQQKDETLYALQVPNVPVAVFLRFANQYAYVSLGSSAAVEPKALLAAKDVIGGEEKAAAAVRIFIERLPKEVKDFILGSIDSVGAQFKEAELFPPAIQSAMEDYLKMALRWYRMGLEDGRDLTYRFDLDPKSGFIVEAVVDPKPGTKLAASIKGVPANQNRFAGLVGGDSAAHGFLSLPLYVPELQSMLVKLTDAAAKETMANIERGQGPKEAKDVAAEAFNALKRTLEGGSMDLATSLRGPNKEGQFAAVGAVTLKDTRQLEKAVKEATKLIPPQQAGLFKLDAHKVGEVSVHEIAVGDTLSPEVQRVFGKASVFVAFAPDAVVVSFGTSGLDLVKEALNSRPGPAPLFHAEIAGKRMAELVKRAADKKDFNENDPEAGMWVNLLTRQERLTLFSMDVQGGERLTMRANYGMMPLMMFGWVFSARSSQEFRAVPPPAAQPAK